MTSAGGLSGSLAEFELVELLQVIGMSTRTGALHINDTGGRSGLIYFESGYLVSCSELDTEALTLGAVLQQLNLASAPQMEHAFHLQTQDLLGKRIGERLIDLGILTADQLGQALRTQTLWTTRELALWHEGAYEFHPGERLADSSNTVKIDTTNAVMEVLRYKHEWESLQPYLPQGMRTHIVMASDPPIGHQLVFHPSAWRVIAKVNGQHTVRRIATALRAPEVEVARMIGPLIQEGLLVPVGAGGGPGLPEEAARLSMHNFDLFTLLISMEQEWLKKKTPADHLVALASFVNRTLRALEDACRLTGLNLAPETLSTLVERERLGTIEGYRFRIEHNAINLDDFAHFCKRTFDGSARGSIGASKVFYDEASQHLLAMLAVAFQAINARVASPLERQQNQEAWEALFVTFRGDEHDD